MFHLLFKFFSVGGYLNCYQCLALQTMLKIYLCINVHNYIPVFYFNFLIKNLFFLAGHHHLWDLSSPTGRQCRDNHWTARELPTSRCLKFYTVDLESEIAVCVLIVLGHFLKMCSSFHSLSHQEYVSFLFHSVLTNSGYSCFNFSLFCQLDGQKLMYHFKKFFNLFYFWLLLGLHCCAWAFSGCCKWGLLSSCNA